MMNPKITIAIDGFAGSGKSTTAKAVAKHLNYIYIDTGAMYRAVTLYFLRNEIDFSQDVQVKEALESLTITFQYNLESQKSDTYLNGENVESEIRKMYISQKVSEVSRVPEVRHAMVAQQQSMGQQKGIVMDGRDIGTVVFPDADLKIFMQTNVNIRAKRRQAELKERGEEIELSEIIENLIKRDQIDTTRKEGPLRKAEDALVLDSSEVSIGEQIKYVLALAEEKITQLY
jgi:cytidylate kinase